MELEQKKKKWEILYDALVTKDYGDIIEHYIIESIIHERYKTNKYYSIVNACNKRLLMAGKKLEPIHGAGYRVIQPDCYTAEAIKHYTRGAREFQRGQDTIDYAPTELMSPAAYQEYKRIQDKAISLSRMVVGGMVEIRRVNRIQHPAIQALKEANTN